jgi:hypothetical protein
MQQEEIRQLINQELPSKIDEFGIMSGNIGNNYFISYSKDIKSIISNNLKLQKESDIDEYTRNVLYDVIGNNLEDCFHKMKQKIELNRRLTSEFKTNVTLGFRPTYKYSYKGINHFYKLFEIYLVIDSNSESQFFAAVTTNPSLDAKYILQVINSLKTQIAQGKLIKLSGEDFDYKDFYLPKKIHLYCNDFLQTKSSIREIFKKSGWSISFRDKYYFDQQSKLKKEKIILCEGNNYKILNNLTLPNILFSEEHNSVSIFENIKTRIKYALRDKDYLLSAEVLLLKQKFTKYYILDYYCIENYLYHPDNLAEISPKGYSKEIYIEEIIRCKNELLSKPLNIDAIRKCYVELKYHKLKKIHNAESQIIEELNSNDFETFYQHFDMKKYFKKTYLSAWNLNENKLSATNWFKNKILKIIKDRK